MGGRGLAIVGGLAVLIGIVFFVAVAIRRGLFPPSLRMAAAALGSALLVVVAERLHRRGFDRTLVGVLATVGILGAFATMVASIAHFELLPERVSVLLAPVIGAASVWCAHRFGLRFMAPMGLIVALIGPAWSGLGISTGLSVYMLAVFAAGCAVAVRFGWQELWPIGLAGVFLAWAPWLSQTYIERDRAWMGLLGLAALLAVNVLTAVLGDVRFAGKRPIAPMTLVVMPIAVTISAGMGVALTRDLDLTTAVGNWWVTLLALALLSTGLGVYRQNPQRMVGPYLAVIGFALGGVAIGMWFDGPGRVIGWAAQGVVGAWAAQRLRDDRALAGGLVAIGAATVNALALAPPRGLGWTIDHPWQGVTAVLVVAIGFGAIAWLTRQLPEKFITMEGNRTRLLGAVAALAAWFGGSVALVQGLGTDRQSTQVVLSVVWAIIGLAMIVVGLMRAMRTVRIVGLALLGLSLAKIVLFDLRYLDSTARALSFILVGLLALAGAYAYQRVLTGLGGRDGDDADRDRDDTPTDRVDGADE